LGRAIGDVEVGWITATRRKRMPKEKHNSIFDSQFIPEVIIGIRERSRCQHCGAQHTDEER
jgi:hypothetical protein